MTISIMLADDHPVVLQGLRVLLEAEPDLTVVGQAVDGLEALALLKRLQPQVLLLDLMLPHSTASKWPAVPSGGRPGRR